MRRPSALHRAAAVVLLAGLAPLAGCAGADDASPSDADDSSEPAAAVDPVSAVQDAVDATLEIRAFAIDSDLDLTLADQRLELTTEGDVDYDAVVADFELAVVQDGERQEVGLLSDGETVWVRASGSTVPAFPDGATWVAGDATELGSAASFEPSGLLGTVFLLRGASEVEEVGTDEVDGVEVTRYASTFTYEDAAAAAASDVGTLEEAFSLTGAAASLPLEVEVAVGSDGVVREMTFEVVGGDAPASGGYDLELSDVGEAVEPPSAPDDVATGPAADALLDRLIS